MSLKLQISLIGNKGVILEERTSIWSRDMGFSRFELHARSIFGIPMTSPMKISYLDETSDNIRVSSDSEWKDAMGLAIELLDGVLPIQIEAEGFVPQKQQPSQPHAQPQQPSVETAPQPQSQPQTQQQKPQQAQTAQQQPQSQQQQPQQQSQQQQQQSWNPLAAFLPMMFGGGFSPSQNTNNRQNTSQQQSQQTANMIASLINSIPPDQIASILGALATNPQLQQSIPQLIETWNRASQQQNPTGAANTTNTSNTTNNKYANEQHAVVCDECRLKVVGVRYKCCSCEDFDLCENCEAKNTHDESHVLLKIKKARVEVPTVRANRPASAQPIPFVSSVPVAAASPLLQQNTQRKQSQPFVPPFHSLAQQQRAPTPQAIPVSPAPVSTSTPSVFTKPAAAQQQQQTNEQQNNVQQQQSQQQQAPQQQTPQEKHMRQPDIEKSQQPAFAFQSGLDTLASMGFTNRETNMQLLSMYNGDVESVISHLVSGY